MTAFAMAYLVAYTAVTGTVLGALAMIMIASLTGATWFVVLRRQAENVVALLPWLALLFLPMLALAPHLYPWAAPDRLPAEAREFVERRHAILSLPGFAIRAAIYFAVWIGFATALRRESLRQDRGEPARARARLVTLSAAGLPLLGLTMSLAAFDWMMALSLPWHSTVYGLYYCTAGFLAAVALLAVLAGMEARPEGPLAPLVGPDHRHALGKVMLAGLMLWAYMAYSQFLVIWIGDLPREVVWYLARMKTGWGTLGWLLVLGHFALPFALLLSRGLKRDRRTSLGLGLWLLAMHYLDMEWLLGPEASPSRPTHAWLDLIVLAAMVASCLLVGRWRLRRVKPYPAGDPLLSPSAHYKSP